MRRVTLGAKCNLICTSRDGVLSRNSYEPFIKKFAVSIFGSSEFLCAAITREKATSRLPKNAGSSKGAATGADPTSAARTAKSEEVRMMARKTLRDDAETMRALDEIEESRGGEAVGKD